MKNNQYVIALITLLFLNITSCGDGGGAIVDTKEEQPYFSLIDFFDAEIERLEADEAAKLEKRVLLNGMEEFKNWTNQKLDWNQELSVFKNSDINRKAWLDKYETIENKQVTADGGEVRQVEYKAKEADLKTRFIKLRFRDQSEEPEYIEIRNGTKNMIYKGYEKLWYKTGEKYRVENVQKVIFNDLDQMIIEVQWF